MNRLEESLNRLQALVNEWGAPARWSRVLIAEDASVSRSGPSLIRRGELFTPEQYADKFDAHLNKGYSWINMNAAGVVGDALLVVIELPGYASGLPKDKVTVNYSGAAFVNGKPDWNAARRFRIVN